MSPLNITQPLGIWSIMATFSGDVQYSQNGTVTNPCDPWEWWNGYGSIPINTIFGGMNIHKSQLFWCSPGVLLTHPQICGESAGTGWTLDGEAMRSWWIHRIFPSISEISGKSENPNYQCPWLWLGGIFFHDFHISLTIKISGWWFGVFLIHDIWESSSQLTKSIIFQEG